MRRWIAYTVSQRNDLEVVLYFHNIVIAFPKWFNGPQSPTALANPVSRQKYVFYNVAGRRVQYFHVADYFVAFPFGVNDDLTNILQRNHIAFLAQWVVAFPKRFFVPYCVEVIVQFPFQDPFGINPFVFVGRVSALQQNVPYD